MVTWLMHQKFAMREVSQPAEIYSVSRLPLGFMLVSLFHSINGAIDGLNDV
jgi:hypothetical protein